MRNYGDEEDEEQRLICKVVEYINPSMAKELLGKFPDNSAYDFDYTQSSIWSPLVPRPYISKNPKPVSLNMSLEITPSPRMKKSSCFFGLMNKSVTKKIKKKINNPVSVSVSGFDLNGMKKKSNKKIKHSKEFDFSSTSSTKGWNKVLKAASKHFKKKKKKDPMAHIKLSKCLNDEDSLIL